MSLLTEKQIAELVKMASVTNSATSYHDDLCEWNKKQQPEPFEPDWSTAPDYAVGAAISLAWVTECGNWGFGGNIARFDKPAAPVTAHPHAAIMAKYAEVAAKRVDPWVEFERYNYLTGGWDRLDEHPSWRPNVIYHYFGDNK